MNTDVVELEHSNNKYYASAFRYTRDDNLRRKHQRKRIKLSIFQKGSKKNPGHLNRGNQQ